jgi:hypothetical protein
MSLTLDLDLEPDEQARLETLAKERGLPVNAYAYAVLKREIATAPPRKRRSLLEFEGVGAKYATGQDAQEYVNELRSEWDHRP